MSSPKWSAVGYTKSGGKHLREGNTRCHSGEVGVSQAGLRSRKSATESGPPGKWGCGGVEMCLVGSRIVFWTQGILDAHFKEWYDKTIIYSNSMIAESREELGMEFRDGCHWLQRCKVEDHDSLTSFIPCVTLDIPFNRLILNLICPKFNRVDTVP